MLRKIYRTVFITLILSISLLLGESISFANELTIKTIEISGNSHFTDTEIIQALGLHPGEKFSYEKLNHNIENILQLY
ncbi:MAG: FtsQ-type POTRA domain-containing protein, partial [Actinobacteria bacterium]|nr:FtsQ-type POTRA domain-containing protein [Actinomycetota bacterium]